MIGYEYEYSYTTIGYIKKDNVVCSTLSHIYIYRLVGSVIIKCIHHSNIIVANWWPQI